MGNRKLLSIFLACSLALSGCAARVKNITDLPPGVTLAEVQAWDSEVAALHRVAVTTSAVRQGILGLQQAGAFPNDAAYVKVLQVIAKIDQAELEASAYLRGTPNTFGATQKVKLQSILQRMKDAVNSPEFQSLASIKNPKTAGNISFLVNDFVAAFTLALTFIN